MSKKSRRNKPAKTTPQSKSAPQVAPAAPESPRETALREAIIDLYAAFGWGQTGRDFAFSASDSMGYPGRPGVFPPYFQDNTKAGECIPVYRSEGELKAIRDYTRVLAAGNEYAHGIIENRVNYIVGNGFTYAAVPKDPKNKQHRVSAEKVRAVIDHWHDLNDLTELEGEALARADVDGEFILRRFTDSDGWDHLRYVDPEHLKSPNGSASDRQYSFGIITPKDDVVRVLGYSIVENPLDSLTPRDVPAEEVVHFTLNANSTAKRGLPSFFPVEANLRRAEKLQTCMTQLAVNRSAIAIIRKIKGLTQGTAANHIAALSAGQVTDPLTGQQTNVEQYRPGTVLTTNENTEYEMPAGNLGTTETVESLRCELRSIATAFCMPEWMVSAKADDKYANAFATEGPTFKAFSRLQSRLCDVFGNKRSGPRTSLLWRQLRESVKHGRLTEQDLKNVTVTCRGPSLEARDRMAEVNRHKELVASGFESVESAQRALELDPEVEAPLLAQDASTKPRPVTDLTAISAVQQSYYTGALPREAALASLVVVLGIEQSRAALLLPEKPVPDPQPAPQPLTPPTDPAPDLQPPEKQEQPSATESVGVREQQHAYSSTQVMLTPELTERVLELGRRIPDSVLAADGREAEPHITCRFGLHGDQSGAVERLVAGVAPVKYRLGAVSVFPNPEHDVVKVEVDSPDLHGLHELLGELPHTDTHPQYLPHVTLAYVQVGKGAEVAESLGRVDAEGAATELVFSDPDRKQTVIPLTAG